MPNPSPKPALFLDRDGIIIKDKGYVHRLEDIELIDGIADLLVAAKAKQYLCLVVTNQSGVARGYFPIEAVHRCHAEIQSILQQHQAPPLDDFFICPHHPNGKVDQYRQDCTCRKPKTGLLQQCAERYDLDLDQSLMIGDKSTDVTCAEDFGIPGYQLTDHFDLKSKRLSRLNQLLPFL